MAQTRTGATAQANLRHLCDPRLTPSDAVIGGAHLGEPFRGFEV